jgi:hypothetical protein
VSRTAGKPLACEPVVTRGDRQNSQKVLRCPQLEAPADSS